MYMELNDVLILSMNQSSNKSIYYIYACSNHFSDRVLQAYLCGLDGSVCSLHNHIARAKMVVEATRPSMQERVYGAGVQYAHNLDPNGWFLDIDWNQSMFHYYHEK